MFLTPVADGRADGRADANNSTPSNLQSTPLLIAYLFIRRTGVKVIWRTIRRKRRYIYNHKDTRTWVMNVVGRSSHDLRIMSHSSLHNHSCLHVEGEKNNFYLWSGSPSFFFSSSVFWLISNESTMYIQWRISVGVAKVLVNKDITFECIWLWSLSLFYFTPNTLIYYSNLQLNRGKSVRWKK